MKKTLFIFIAAALSLSLVAFTYTNRQQATAKNSEVPVEGIKWLTWEQAVELNKTTPKKFVIDVYTDWCGWCKVMDRETFTKPEIIKYISENYYAVKFNAEQKADLDFNGHKFTYVAGNNGRGYHSFAASLLDNNMGYPSLVYLNEKFERVVISPGYKTADQLIKELKFTGENAYEKMSWEKYMEEK